MVEVKVDLWSVEVYAPSAFTCKYTLVCAAVGIGKTVASSSAEVKVVCRLHRFVS